MPALKSEMQEMCDNDRKKSIIMIIRIKQLYILWWCCWWLWWLLLLFLLSRLFYVFIIHIEKTYQLVNHKTLDGKYLVSILRRDYFLVIVAINLSHAFPQWRNNNKNNNIIVYQIQRKKRQTFCSLSSFISGHWGNWMWKIGYPCNR